jgi:hypothetical protein
LTSVFVPFLVPFVVPFSVLASAVWVIFLDISSDST